MNQTIPIPDGNILPDPDPRVAEILGAVRHAFSQKGFDGASMQDLARAAGMSVGNFYRYFRSKSDIVVAIIESDLRAIEADFAAVLCQPDAFACLKAAMRQRLPVHQVTRDGDLWAEISAVAMRNSTIGAAASRMEHRIRLALLTVIARQTGLSPVETARRFAAEADFILLLFKSSSCLDAAETVHRDRVNALILGSIDQTLDMIVQNARNS